MVRIPAGRGAVRHEGARPAQEQAQQPGTQMRLGGRFVLQPRYHRRPAGRTDDGGRIGANIRAGNDHGGLHYVVAFPRKCTHSIEAEVHLAG